MNSDIAVYNGKIKPTFSQFAGLPQTPLWCSAGVVNGRFIAALVSGNTLYLASDDGSVVSTGVTTQYRPSIYAGYVYYIENGDHKRAPIDDASLSLGTPEVVSAGAAPNGGFCGDDRILVYQDGRLQTPDGSVVFVPYTVRQNGLLGMNAIVTRDTALFMQDDGSIVDPNGRIALAPDLAAFVMDGTFHVGGNTFITGRYVHTGHLDDGTVDYVILPLRNGVIAMPPYALVYGAPSDEGPMCATYYNEKVFVVLGDKYAVHDAPWWISQLTPKYAAHNVLVSMRISPDRASISLPREEPKPEKFDKIVVTIHDETGDHTFEMIVSDVYEAKNGANWRTNVSGAPPVAWHLQNTRLPNYMEIRFSGTTVDTEPWKMEKLYPAPNPSPSSGLPFAFVDFWDAEPFSYNGIPGIEITKGALAPISRENGGLIARPANEIVVTGPSVTFEIRGWSSANSGYNNHTITLVLEVKRNGEKQTIEIGSGSWPKTYNGTSSGSYPITLTSGSELQPGDAITGIAIVATSQSGSGAVFYPASVYVYGDVAWLSDKGVATWKAIDGVGLSLSTVGRESALLATAPYAHPGNVVIAASFDVEQGDLPNTNGETWYGIVYAAKDLQNMSVIAVSTSGTGEIFTVRNGVRTTLDTFSAGPLSSPPVGMIVYLGGGELKIYATDKDLRNWPGTLVHSYVWSSADGDFMPGTERHVGVYGYIETPKALALGWGKRGKILVLDPAQSLPASGKVEFADGTTVTYTSRQGAGNIPDGPWQLRNLQSWPSGYSDNGNSGMAIEITKLDWGAAQSKYNGLTFCDNHGELLGTVRANDTTPFTKTGGVKQYLHNRMRLYSDGLSGKEIVGLDTKVFLGGDFLTGVSFGTSYVNPPEVMSLATTEKVILTKFVTFHGFATISDAASYMARVANVDLDRPQQTIDTGEYTRDDLFG